MYSPSQLAGPDFDNWLAHQLIASSPGTPRDLRDRGTMTSVVREECDVHLGEDQP